MLLRDHFNSTNSFAPDMPVEYVEVDEIRFAANGASTPCVGGSSIGNVNGQLSGTLGAWLREQISGNILGISNEHVLTENGTHHIPSEVIHPGKGDSSPSTTKVIGEVVGSVPLELYDRNNLAQSLNDVDFAWCKPLADVGVDHTIAPLGITPTKKVDLVPALSGGVTAIPVSLNGKTSGHTHGKIMGLAPLKIVKDNQGNKFAFQDQFEIRFDSIGQGDSGALLLSHIGDNAVGLFHSISFSDPILGFATPWSKLEDASNLSFF